MMGTTKFTRLAKTSRFYRGAFITENEEVVHIDEEIFVVRTRAYNETHYRFRLDNVAGLTLIRTRRYRTTAAALLLVLVLLAALGMVLHFVNFPHEQDLIYLPFFLMPSILPILALIIHLALGPTCRVVLVTAASAVPLLSLDRVRKARRVIREIAALTERAAGTSSGT